MHYALDERRAHQTYPRPEAEVVPFTIDDVRPFHFIEMRRADTTWQCSSKESDTTDHLHFTSCSRCLFSCFWKESRLHNGRAYYVSTLASRNIAYRNPKPLYQQPHLHYLLVAVLDREPRTLPGNTTTFFGRPTGSPASIRTYHTISNSVGVAWRLGPCIIGNQIANTTRTQHSGTMLYILHHPLNHHIPSDHHVQRSCLDLQNSICSRIHHLLFAVVGFIITQVPDFFFFDS